MGPERDDAEVVKGSIMEAIGKITADPRATALGNKQTRADQVSQVAHPRRANRSHPEETLESPGGHAVGFIDQSLP